MVFTGFRKPMGAKRIHCESHGEEFRLEPATAARGAGRGIHVTTDVLFYELALTLGRESLGLVYQAFEGLSDDAGGGALCEVHLNGDFAGAVEERVFEIFGQSRKRGFEVHLKVSGEGGDLAVVNGFELRVFA